jgi:hypothetical protein
MWMLSVSLQRGAWPPGPEYRALRPPRPAFGHHGVNAGNSRGPGRGLEAGARAAGHRVANARHGCFGWPHRGLVQAAAAPALTAATPSAATARRIRGIVGLAGQIAATAPVIAGIAKAVAAATHWPPTTQWPPPVQPRRGAAGQRRSKTTSACCRPPRGECLALLRRLAAPWACPRRCGAGTDSGDAAGQRRSKTTSACDPRVSCVRRSPPGTISVR